VLRESGFPDTDACRDDKGVRREFCVREGNCGRGREMKRVMFVLFLAVGAFLGLAATAGGTHSNGTGPKQELVAGTGRLAGHNEPLVHVNAQKDKDTGETRGHFFIRYPVTAPGGGFDMRGDIECMTTTGVPGFMKAGLVGRIERITGINPFGPGGANFFVGNALQITITDLGEPGTFDQADFSPAETPPRNPSCSPGGGQILQSGNYIVHQDPPLELLSILDALLAEFEAAAGPH
jgi:hypothetical protein